LKEIPSGRVGTPANGFDAEAISYIGCPSDRADWHGQLCRKALKDENLSAALLRVAAQI